MSTPLGACFKPLSVLSSHTKEKVEHMPHIPYTSVVRIMYAIIYTRLDISYAVSVVSRHMYHL